MATLLRVQQFILDEKNEAYFHDTPLGLAQAQQRIREIVARIHATAPWCDEDDINSLAVERVRAGDQDGGFEPVWCYEDGFPAERDEQQAAAAASAMGSEQISSQ